MSENKGCYDEELDYYKSKCASLEEGLFKADRERAKLEKENEQLKQREKTLEGMIRTFDEGCKEIYDDNSRLEKENEQFKQQINYYEKLITDKEVEWLRDNTVWEQMPSSKRTVTKTSKNLN